MTVARSARRTAPRVVVVDWSAAATPRLGADSIWICTLDGDDVDLRNHATRAEAERALHEIAARPGATIIGVDFPLGYPAGFAARLGLTGTPWSAVWAHLAAHVTDDERNANNRWEVAASMNRALGRAHFWGSPPARSGPHLPTTRPTWTEHHLPTVRRCEAALQARGLRPFTVWQLLGAGSVGSQALMGIPVLHRLRHHPALADRVRVWPFETPVADGVTVAEVWPSMIPFDHVDHPVKDARQVTALAHWLRDRWLADTDGLFAVPDPADQEEGWVLGVQA